MTTPSPADQSWALASSEEEQARALAQRYGLEYVDVGSFAPDPELLKSVPVELMFRYAFLPYRREGERLVLVMADPTALPVVDELSLVITAAIDGSSGAPTVFNSGDTDLGPAPIESMTLISHQVLEKGAVWLRYKLGS